MAGFAPFPSPSPEASTDEDDDAGADEDVASSISTCVISFLSLYTCFFMYAILISVSHMMP